MADLSTGADAVGGERFADCEYNEIKNHWRQSSPCINLANRQPGMILSNSDDDRLYHVITGATCSQIVQVAVPVSDNAYIGFGTDLDARIGYDELTNDALMLGVPFNAKRGLIVCNVDQIGQNMTALIAVVAQPRISFIDADTDSAFGIGYWGDDIPAIVSGQHPLNINYSGDQDVYFFLNSVAGENRNTRLYGYITAGAAVRHANLRMDDTNDEFEIDAENNANHEGITILIQEANQKFRVRGNARAMEFFIKADGKIGTNQTAAGTTLGSVVKKLTMYDENEGLVGYLPIYDAIT